MPGSLGIRRRPYSRVELLGDAVMNVATGAEKRRCIRKVHSEGFFFFFFFFFCACPHYLLELAWEPTGIAEEQLNIQLGVRVGEWLARQK